MKKIIFLLVSAICLLLMPYLVKGQEVDSYIMIRPQFKLGKVENGNGFAEIQYAKIRYQFDPKFSIAAGISTGFTSPRSSLMNFNHAVNRFGIKSTYNVTDSLGLFVEGSFSQRISGSNNDVSYFVYDTYQAIGVSLEVKKYSLK